MNNRIIARLKEITYILVAKITDILMPKEEKVKILEQLGPDGLFENIPRSENFDFETDKIKAIFNYKTVLCRQAIWEIKYQANKKLIQDFSLLLYEYILEEMSDLETFKNFKNTILIPIPASKQRVREKGFNQCTLIVRELIKIDRERNGNNFTLLENFLIKNADTPHQTKVSNRKKRLENIKGSFSINEGAWLSSGKYLGAIRFPLSEEAFSGTRPTDNHSESFSSIQPLSDYSFIIIDDVITTGATMDEAFRVLKSAGVSPNKIRGFALAH